jgi:hypothetical protein
MTRRIRPGNRVVTRRSARAQSHGAWKSTRSRVTREEWAKRVERWRDSELWAAEFAAGLGINARTLVYWKYILGKEARGERRVWPSRKAHRGRTARRVADETLTSRTITTDLVEVQR